MVTRIENFFLRNAPAGSGKTTEMIKHMNSFRIKNPNDRILCITFTNRAANEVLKGIDDDYLDVFTIHSFLASFLKNHFRTKEIINLYLELFEDEIRSSIKGITEGDQRKNERFKEKYGGLDWDKVVETINNVYYTESEFDSLYNGGLSHDRLLLFAYHAFNRFSVLKKRLSSKYQIIYLDEYQDTSTNVLNLLYDSLRSSDVNLYLFGDKMQQIYDQYDGEFDKKLKDFNPIEKDLINYRSSPKIVDLLNHIYNNSTYNQEKFCGNEKLENNIPKAIFCNDINGQVEIESHKYPGALRLYLFNKERFKEMGCESLYNAYTNLDRYKFGRNRSAVNVLTQNFEEQSDELLKLCYLLFQIFEYYQENNIGSIIQRLKEYPDFFDLRVININNHETRIKSLQKLKELNDIYQREDTSILNLIRGVAGIGFLHKNTLENLEETYNEALEIRVSEFNNLIYYLDKETISTQHAVKGESHNDVFFIHNNSKGVNPNVKMDNFFKLWSKVDFNLDELREIVYNFSMLQSNVEHIIGTPISEITPTQFEAKQQEIVELIKDYNEKYENNPIYRAMVDLEIVKLMERENKTQLIKFLKKHQLEGIENAYKIFYVGCSRAKNNLIVFVDKSKISEVEEDLRTKMSSVGFEVEVR